jgi:NagD protein
MTAATRQSWLVDLDGVLIHDGRAIPGACSFLDRLGATSTPFVVLTNNSLFSPDEQSERLSALGLTVLPHQFWTSAQATARFLKDQRPGGSAFVIGRTALTTALNDAGYRLDDQAPDSVVLGETQNYSFEEFTTAIRLIDRGAHFVATNPEPTGPDRNGPLPACGAVAALLERATGVTPYFVGKPNPLMLTQAIALLEGDPRATTIVGDRMETDVAAGVSLGLETVLALSGVTSRADLAQHSFQPSRVVESVAQLVEDLAPRA